MRERIISVLQDANKEIVADLDKDLLATGVLDSFELVNLVVELEDALDIEIDAELVVPENFQTGNAIIQLLESILEA